MRIGVDARLLLMPLRGMGVNLNRVLNEILAEDREDQFFLYVDSTYEHNAPVEQYEPRLRALAAYPNVTIVDVHAFSEFLWEQFHMPMTARRHKLDVLHTPANRASYWRAARKMVATVHDTLEVLPSEVMPAPPSLPGLRGRFYVWRAKQYVDFVFRRVFQRLDLIITDSLHSSADIQRFCNVPPEKIRVIHLAPNEMFKKLYVEKGDYLLAFGSVAPHKNCERLLRAYAALPDEVKRRHPLRMVGTTPALEQLAADLAEPQISFEPSDFSPELVETFNRALVFLFVSLYEGFGIPPVESMACGTAVIASSAASIPEVVGDAALVVDPTDVNQIRDAMVRLLTDESLRRTLEAAGEQRARMFSWKDSAARHLEAYRQLAAT